MTATDSAIPQKAGQVGTNCRTLTIDTVRNHIVGIDKQVPLLDGTMRQYIFFDNAASTPPLTDVRDTINEFLEWYSAVHRGTGFKSHVATEIYDQAHDIVGQFVHADLSTNTVIFGKNTTEAINKLANRLELQRDDVVLLSRMEHHSNDLPWRKHATVEWVKIHADGSLDLEDFNAKLQRHKGRLKIAAITGASNITGIVNPIYELAEQVHAIGAKFLVDAAQLAPHRAIDMKSDDDPQHIDFLVLSAHKMYAPFGTGALIGPKEVFVNGEPDYVGGGTVSAVTKDEVHWTHLPDKDEAGSPNVIGAVALAKAMMVLNEVGMDEITAHESKLTSYLLRHLCSMEDIEIYGPKNCEDVENRLGVVSFNVRGMDNALVAAILSYEGGIGVRNGCFCAHPYIKELLGITKEESDRMIQRLLNHDRSYLPGAVRISFGIYNTEEEIDSFLEVLQKIVRREYRGEYILHKRSGMYSAKGFEPSVSEYFRL
jgi:selenocysteine lyase/cysteine desulfurase